MPRTMKEELEEAFAKAETTTEEEEEVVGEEEETENDDKTPKDPEPEGEDKVDDETPDKEGEDDTPDDEQVSESDDDTGDEESPAEEEEVVAEEEIKAPASWKPAVREHWKGLPKDVKEEVLRREQEISRGLQQASGHRKVAEEYVATVRPYESMIRAAGASPSQAIDAMFQSAHKLTFGNPSQKAQVVKDIIQNYSVDIETLDNVLADIEVPDDVNAGLLRHLDERLAPVTNFMKSMQTQEQTEAQRIQEQVDNELTKFASDLKNEFYEDVREDMADIMELGAKRGRNVTLQEAYNQACQLNPDIKKVVDHRSERLRSQPSGEELAKKKKAASSVPGESPGGGKVKKESEQVLDSVREAWDALESR